MTHSEMKQVLCNKNKRVLLMIVEVKYGYELKKIRLDHNVDITILIDEFFLGGNRNLVFFLRLCIC